jgi:hypothetical protein
VSTIEQIEEDVKRLSAVQQRELLSRLVGIVSKRDGSGIRRSALASFFAEWDSKHNVTVGEKPTRARTYADNPRIR